MATSCYQITYNRWQNSYIHRPIHITPDSVDLQFYQKRAAPRKVKDSLFSGNAKNL